MILKKVFTALAIFLLAGCEIGGVTLTRPAVFCEFENEKYQPGETISLSDGCNSCICSSAGEVGNCTEMVCEEIQQNPVASLANPAAVKCSVDGYRYEIR